MAEEITEPVVTEPVKTEPKVEPVSTLDHVVEPEPVKVEPVVPSEPAPVVVEPPKTVEPTQTTSEPIKVNTTTTSPVVTESKVEPVVEEIVAPKLTDAEQTEIDKLKAEKEAKVVEPVKDAEGNIIVADPAVPGGDKTVINKIVPPKEADPVKPEEPTKETLEEQYFKLLRSQSYNAETKDDLMNNSKYNVPDGFEEVHSCPACKREHQYKMNAEKSFSCGFCGHVGYAPYTTLRRIKP